MRKLLLALALVAIATPALAKKERAPVTPAAITADQPTGKWCELPEPVTTTPPRISGRTTSAATARPATTTAAGSSSSPAVTRSKTRSAGTPASAAARTGCSTSAQLEAKPRPAFTSGRTTPPRTIWCGAPSTTRKTTETEAVQRSRHPPWCLSRCIPQLIASPHVAPIFARRRCRSRSARPSSCITTRTSSGNSAISMRLRRLAKLNATIGWRSSGALAT